MKLIIDVMSSESNNLKIIWLAISAMLVLSMVTIGGYTRLSNAGLSVVEWKPVTGAIPPISAENWQDEFNKYRATPEFKQINSYMSLDEFKHIYWIEYFHRFMGRITVLFYLIPFLYFALTKRLGRAIWQHSFIVVLFLSQGLMGWLMVKSGLVEAPHVSHFRLSAHLMLAVFTYSMIIWQLFQYISPKVSKVNVTKNEFYAGIVLLVFVYLQLMLGGFVAGLEAGLIYNSFPLMGESFVPMEWSSFSVEMFSDAVNVQFLHRIGGYVVFLFCCMYAYYLSTKNAIKSAVFLVSIAILQMLLGVSTLVLQVPLILALLHQLAAVLLVTAALWAHYYNIRKL